MTHRVGWYGGALIQQGMHFSWPPHEGIMQLSGGEICACYMNVFFMLKGDRIGLLESKTLLISYLEINLFKAVHNTI